VEKTGGAWLLTILMENGRFDSRFDVKKERRRGFITMFEKGFLG